MFPDDSLLWNPLALPIHRFGTNRADNNPYLYFECNPVLREDVWLGWLWLCLWHHQQPILVFNLKLLCSHGVPDSSVRFGLNSWSSISVTKLDLRVDWQMHWFADMGYHEERTWVHWHAPWVWWFRQSVLPFRRILCHVADNRADMVLEDVTE